MCTAPGVRRHVCRRRQPELDDLSGWPFRFFLSHGQERLHVHAQSADGEVKFWIEPVIELPEHFHWPGPDVDLGLDSIEHPERYPLKSLL